MDATSPAETAIKPSTGYHVAAYDPDDDPYALPEPESKKVPVVTGEEINQSIPQMEIEAKPAERSEEEQTVVPTQAQQESKDETVVPPAKDPLQASTPETETMTPPTTLPDPTPPRRASHPSPALQQKPTRGEEPIASNSCRCCLM